MMIDPDYPHHAAGQFYLHWLITNIPVSVFFFSSISLKKLVCYIRFNFTIQGEWLRQGITYDIGEYIVGKLNTIFCFFLPTINVSTKLI